MNRDAARKAVAVALVFGVVMATILAIVGTGDGGGDEPVADSGPTSAVTVPTTAAPETGGIVVPEAPGTFPVAVPELGFGVAVPENWQATLLSPEALERIADADLDQPFFLDAATQVASTGAIFYAAGIDGQGRVSELKLDVQLDVDASPEGVRATADAVVDSAGVPDAEVVELDGGRVRVDFRLEQPAADDGEPIEAFTSQLFVPDGTRLWSLIVTSEESVTQDLLVDLFDQTFVVQGD